MENKKGPYSVKELKALGPGKQVWGKFLVLEKIDRRTREGKAVSNLRLGDISGEVDAVAWESCTLSGSVEVGAVVGILGDTSVYNNRLQITARRIKGLEEDSLPYLRSASGLPSLQREFLSLVDSVKDPYLKAVLDRVFSDSVRESFFRAPAARRIHHHYAGGLLEHTLSVASLCLDASRRYPFLNRELLLTGALLHDIGKVEELRMKPAAEYTVSGRMLGHIYLGSEMVSAAIADLRLGGNDFPQELEVMIKHLVLSHHGLLEFGSPVKPLFPEALLLHMMDNLDAKVFVFWNRMQEDEDSSEEFTPYDNMFDQHFYKYRYQYAELGEEDPGDCVEYESEST
ncbi:MAG TPA: HD domain-containing protein [Syntrophomonadaceae bacterium]|nr:HD domain-containing protein [Syntrophomonadaceae bacterium]